MCRSNIVCIFIYLLKYRFCHAFHAKLSHLCWRLKAVCILNREQFALSLHLHESLGITWRRITNQMAQTGASHVGKKKTKHTSFCAFFFSASRIMEIWVLFHVPQTNIFLPTTWSLWIWPDLSEADTFSGGCCKILCSKMLICDLMLENNPFGLNRSCSFIR